MKNRIPELVVLLAAALASGGAAALASDSRQPINIEADQADADDLKRVTIYKGNVIIVQGTLRITGDVVTIHYDERREITKMISVGRPARFRQLPDGKPEYQRAHARRMEYHAGKNQIVLIGDAHYAEASDTIAADRIVYDTVKATARADTRVTVRQGEPARPEGRSRVRITITPQKKCPDGQGGQTDCPEGQ